MFVRGAAAIALLILIIYGFTEARPLISGPSLTLTSPADGQTIPDGVLTVAGKAARVTFIPGLRALHQSLSPSDCGPHSASVPLAAASTEAEAMEFRESF